VGATEGWVLEWSWGRLLKSEENPELRWSHHSQEGGVCPECDGVESGGGQRREVGKVPGLPGAGAERGWSLQE
jgi:hypothetical protein